MKMKKAAASAMAAMIALSMLAGCGDNNTSENNSSKSSESTGSSASAEDVTIWYYWETEGHQKALDKVIQDYNASQDAYEAVSYTHLSTKKQMDSIV